MKGKILIRGLCVIAILALGSIPLTAKDLRGIWYGTYREAPEFGSGSGSISINISYYSAPNSYCLWILPASTSFCGKLILGSDLTVSDYPNTIVLHFDGSSATGYSSYDYGQFAFQPRRYFSLQDGRPRVEFSSGSRMIPPEGGLFDITCTSYVAYGEFNNPACQSVVLPFDAKLATPPFTVVSTSPSWPYETKTVWHFLIPPEPPNYKGPAESWPFKFGGNEPYGGTVFYLQMRATPRTDRFLIKTKAVTLGHRG